MIKMFKEANYQYLWTNYRNGTRLQYQFKALRTSFRTDLTRLMDEYTLAQCLSLAKAGTRPKVAILNLNCGEGLYLHKLAQFLAERNLLEGAILYGLHHDPIVVKLAEEATNKALPARANPSFHFYRHDLALPLDYCRELRQQLRVGQGVEFASPPRFEWIIGCPEALQIVEAQRVLKRLYHHNLAKGGLIYLLEMVLAPKGEDEQGWSDPHPAIGVVSRVVLGMAARLNPGVEVAREVSRWLEEAGAEEVQSLSHCLPSGGRSDEGRAIAKKLLVGLMDLGPQLISGGLLSQVEYIAALAAFYYELTSEMVGEHTYLATLARKPARWQLPGPARVGIAEEEGIQPGRGEMALFPSPLCIEAMTGSNQTKPNRRILRITNASNLL